jgi:DNA-binding transcriptional MerR regulator
LGEAGERDHLSIGEVLTLLKDEFPDVTISKIRFLESQGLLDPERTPSGYRKFYDPDVERLRWILRQQRENFLPLKVIRGKLGEEEVPGTSPATRAASAEAENVTTEDEPDDRPPQPSPVSLVREEPDSEPPRPTAPKATAPRPAAPRPAASEVEEPEEADSLTFEELCERCGLAPERLRELERFGMLSGRSVAGTTWYDAEAISLARLVAAFANHGIEPRHLKMYKNTAEREVALFEQVVTPLLKQRNPKARRQAADTLGELVGLAEELRGLLMRQAVDERGLG